MHPVVFASGHQLQTEDIWFVLLIQQAELVKVPVRKLNLNINIHALVQFVCGKDMTLYNCFITNFVYRYFSC